MTNKCDLFAKRRVSFSSPGFLMDESNFYRAFPPWPVTVQTSLLLIHVATELILLQQRVRFLLNLPLITSSVYHKGAVINVLSFLSLL